MTERDADARMNEARRLQATDVAGAIALARRVLEADPAAVDALEFLAMALVTRRRSFAEGLRHIDRAVELRPDDAGMWYARGWCYEFAAHEVERRPTRESALDSALLYQVAAASFRHCLELKPEGKLADDATDLLEIIEDRIRGSSWTTGLW